MENPNLNDMIQSVHERGKTIYLGMPIFSGQMQT